MVTGTALLVTAITTLWVLHAFSESRTFTWVPDTAFGVTRPTIYAPIPAIMITIDILRICQLKGITHPHAFLTANGFSHRIASTLVNASGKGIRFDHLERLCRLFHAMPHHLFNYKPTGRGINPANDVLLPLRKQPVPAKGLNSLLAALPPDDILNITAELQARFQKPQEPTDGQ